MQQNKTSVFKYLILIIILGIIAFGGGLWLGHTQQKPLAARVKVATVLQEPRELSSFKLTSSNRQPFTNQNLMDHWTILFFGFTTCPQICPTTMATLNQFYQKLTAEKQQPMPQVVMITVDPERDTLPVLKKYVTAFNPQFQGATGTEKAIEQLTKELNIVYLKIQPPGADPEDYQIDHSGALLLINPAGKLVAIFSMPHDANSIASDFVTITHA